MPPVYPAGSYPAKVVADGASAYWRLSETTGTSAVDVIAGNSGTISGGVTLGQAGALSDGDKAMAFNGTTGQISVTAPVLDSFTQITCEAWAFGPTGSVNGTILEKTVGGGANSSWNLLYYAGEWYWRFVESGGIHVASPVPLTQWNYFVGTWDGTALRLYINGVLVGGPVSQAGVQGVGPLLISSLASSIP